MHRPQRRTAYVLKVYPRFSETFVVTEILAREAVGEELAIYSLRPTTDARFHPQLAQVQAPVTHIPRPNRLSAEWQAIRLGEQEVPRFAERFADMLPLLVRMDPAGAAQAVELARRFISDGITHAHAHFASIAGQVTAVASHLAGVEFSVTTHAKDLFHDEVDRELLRMELRRARRVVAISEYNRRFILDEVDATLADKVELVRNGIDMERFDHRDPRPISGALRVLAVGRMVEKKGFDHLLDAIALLVCQGVDIEARLVGTGELFDALHQQVERLGLGGVVAMPGARSQTELVDEFAWADVMVAPCVIGSDGNADGLPTVLLEAMASGVPCIATDVTGIGEAVHGADGDRPATGILLDHSREGLTERIAEALRTVASPDWPRVEIARAARAIVEQEYDTRHQALKVSALEGAARSRKEFS